MRVVDSPLEIDLLPANFVAWFAARGWSPHRHQIAMLAAVRNGQSTLLVAPTGGCKTLPASCPAWSS
jgi:ATP-dependent Lhr-like helicase